MSKSLPMFAERGGSKVPSGQVQQSAKMRQVCFFSRWNMLKLSHFVKGEETKLQPTRRNAKKEQMEEVQMADWTGSVCLACRHMQTEAKLSG